MFCATFFYFRWTFLLDPQPPWFFARLPFFFLVAPSCKLTWNHAKPPPLGFMPQFSCLTLLSSCFPCKFSPMHLRPSKWRDFTVNRLRLRETRSLHRNISLFLPFGLGFPGPLGPVPVFLFLSAPLIVPPSEAV